MASAIEALPMVRRGRRTNLEVCGRRLLTAIVKATHTTHDGMMVPTAPPIAATEKHLRGNPVASLCAAICAPCR
jgi:hypothetical protein